MSRVKRLWAKVEKLEEQLETIHRPLERRVFVCEQTGGMTQGCRSRLLALATGDGGKRDEDTPVKQAVDSGSSPEPATPDLCGAERMSAGERKRHEMFDQCPHCGEPAIAMLKGGE